jgi:two-component sensor histidine kinase
MANVSRETSMGLFSDSLSSRTPQNAMRFAGLARELTQTLFRAYNTAAHIRRFYRIGVIYK